MLRALVVDDDEHILLFVSTVLRSAGYAVTQAPHALEGLALLEGSLKFDVLVTDLKMPFMDGSGFVMAVRQQFPKLPVVVISAHFPDTYTVETPFETVVALRKPLSYQELIDGVKQALSLV